MPTRTLGSPRARRRAAPANSDASESTTSGRQVAQASTTRGQRGLGVEAGEELGGDAAVGLVRAEVAAERGEDRAAAGRVGVGEGPRLEARARRRRRRTALAGGDQHLAALVADGVGEGEERAEVARRAGGRDEDAHGHV